MKTTSLIEQLKQLRIDQGLSQAALSRKAGYWKGSIQSWEVGRYGPSLPALINVAQAMGYEFVLRPIEEVRNAKPD